MNCPDFLCAEGVQNAPCFFEVEMHHVERAVCSECPVFQNCAACFHFSDCLENGRYVDYGDFDKDIREGVPF